MKKYFLAGLATLLPLLLTYLAISFLFNFLTAPFLGAIEKWLTYLKSTPKFSEYSFLFNHETAVFWMAKILALIFLVFFIFAIGALARFLVIKSLFDLSDKAFRQIPGVRKIYISLKEAISHLLHEEKASFSKVVLVPYPHKNTLAIGFLASEQKIQVSPLPGKNLLPILLPGCPNPMMGFVLFFKEEDVQITNIAIEDALKTILSCGVITDLK